MEIEKNIRISVIEIIDLLGDYDQQIEYATMVGDCVAIQEMVCMWFDDIYHPNTDFIKAFSENELIKLKEFNEYYDSICDEIPDQYIGTLHIDQNWEKLVRLAKTLGNELKANESI